MLTALPRAVNCGHSSQSPIEVTTIEVCCAHSSPSLNHTCSGHQLNRPAVMTPAVMMS